MEHVRLGRTGLKVSRLCLGTMNFGPHTTEPDSFAIMDRALEDGIQFFDTADVYGFKPGGGGGPRASGLTEQILAAGSRRATAARARVLAPRSTGRCGTGRNGNKLSASTSAAPARTACAACNRSHRLLPEHHIDRPTRRGRAWQAMDVLVKQGKVLYVGSSNSPAGTSPAQRGRRARHSLGLVSAELYHLQAAHHRGRCSRPAAYGLGLLPWSPLGGGLLGGVLAKESAGVRAGDLVSEEDPDAAPQLERWEALCKDSAGASQRGPGLAAAPAGSRRPSSSRAPASSWWHAALDRDQSLERGAGEDGRDLAGAWRRGARTYAC